MSTERDTAHDQSCRAAERATLERLAAAPDRPEALAPFDRFFADREAEVARMSAGRPLVGQYCNFVPDELVLAAGGFPVRLDSGCHPDAERGERILAPDVCCAVRAAAGALEAGAWPLAACDLVVVPTACDGKKKLSQVLARDHEVMTLELPQTNRGERALDWWQGEIRRLIEGLQKVTSKRIRRGSLRSAVELINRRAALLRRMNELRRGEVPPIRGADAFLVMHAGFTADPAWWVEKTGVLVSELERRAAQGLGIRPKARLLLTGSPVIFPDYKLLELIEAAGADVVADEMCSGTQRLHHPVAVDETTRGGLIRAAAERVLLPCTCPCFTRSDGRRDRLKELADGYQIDGVVHHTIRLCQLYDLDARDMAALFKEMGTPWLELHAEFGPEEAGRMRGRIDAFIEMIAESI